MAVNNAAVASLPIQKIPKHIASVFALAMAGFDLSAPPRIAVGVSGGADSLGLLLLLADWCADKGGALKAYTVDHNLRSDAKAEAEAVAALCHARGIAHEILTWQFDQKPETHIQERARAARYDLLTEACARDGFPVLAVAHHLEDQIETFWMRLTHGSGVDGLAGMTASRALDDVTLIRPVLSMPRENLRDVCTVLGVQWLEDPSNQNENFLRPRLRGFEDMLAAEGLTPQRMATTLQKLADARDILQQVTQETLAQIATVHDMGYVTLDRAQFSALPAALAQRVLSQILSIIAPADYPAGHDLVARLYDALSAEGFSGQTAYGCDISAQGTQHFLFTREQAAIAAPLCVEAGQRLFWDSRFALEAPAWGVQIESLTLSALGISGVAMLRKQLADHLDILVIFENLPGKVRASLPALWSGENLLSVPQLSWVAADAPAVLKKVTVRFTRGFAAATIV